VPVLGGETIYHPSYNDNCLVNVAALGIVEEDRIIHSYVPKKAKSEPYVFILIGKSTDQTGFGGASFSSATLDSDDDMKNVGAVQVHDPFLKRVVVEAIKAMTQELHDQDIEIGFKDLGAGGISCAVSELAAASGFGSEIQLESVNVAHDGLPPEVITCSETQERFCVAVPETVADRVCEIFNVDFDLPRLYHQAGAAIIGKVTQDPHFIVYNGKEQVCHLPINVITTEVQVERNAQSKPIQKHADYEGVPVSEIASLCQSVLGSPQVISKRYVYRFYDNAVRGDTVIYPGEGDAVAVTPVEGCPTGLVVSMDSNVYGEVDPYVSGAAAVAEAVRNIVSVGATPIALTDCLNYGNPEKPEVFFDFEEGVKGISDASNALGFIEGEPLPIISGNVSFYNESSNGKAVVPSPVILAVGRLSHYEKGLTMQLQSSDSRLVLIGDRFPEFGGTLIRQFKEGLNGAAPQVRFSEEARANKVLHSLIQQEKIRSCHDISTGGLWVTLCEMVLGERGNARVGAVLNVPESLDPFTVFFSENGGYLCEVSSDECEGVVDSFKNQNVFVSEIGHTQNVLEVTLSKDSSIIGSFLASDLEAIWNQRSTLNV
ncbi:MAG: phosphoribosylformylglycinamidine synthase, partial [Candidatus Margulisbacteria bacterium]|nr:phosphoribosylformylglycinamidine synthase [Candidatus Margulisiibacteriota bacterium]